MQRLIEWVNYYFGVEIKMTTKSAVLWLMAAALIGFAVVVWLIILTNAISAK